MPLLELSLLETMASLLDIKGKYAFGYLDLRRNDAGRAVPRPADNVPLLP